MVENFLPEIDCEADNGVISQSGFWQVMYTTRSHGRVIRKVLNLPIPGFCSAGLLGIFQEGIGMA